MKPSRANVVRAAVELQSSQLSTAVARRLKQALVALETNKVHCDNNVPLNS